MSGRHVAQTSIRCGIVLAAGDGERLQPYIHRLRGDALPKQYVNFLGAHSMLEHTFRRAEKLISPERLFTVVSKNHLSHSEPRRQLSNRTRGTVVVQPENKETGPGLLLPLIHLYQRYADSTVAVFPSDHFVVEENLFMKHVEMACRVVEHDPSRMVLLGMEPDNPEPEYGYIVPGGEVDTLAPFGVRKVLRFVEKPETRIAQELIVGGGLWNTMVMVFKAKSLLGLVRRIAPALFRVFKRIREVMGAPDEMEVVERVYRYMPRVNFSRGLMEPLALEQPSSLWVLPVRGVFWSDWGSEQRIVSTVQKNGSVDQIHQNPEHRQEQNIDAEEEGLLMERSERMKRKGGSQRGKQPTEGALTEQGVRERVALKAYELYEKRGHAHGCDVEDWLEAEKRVSAGLKEERYVKTEMPRKRSKDSTREK